MRELKFRVWNGAVMVYDVTVGVHGAFYTNGISREDISSLDNTTLYPKSIPVMELTGLHDKTGKEIYEGDILLHDSEGQFTIIWDNDFLGFAAKSEGSNAVDLIHAPYLRQCKIIGNIHENPELLK